MDLKKQFLTRLMNKNRNKKTKFHIWIKKKDFYLGNMEEIPYPVEEEELFLRQNPLL